jgi:hypothetical protein
MKTKILLAVLLCITASVSAQYSKNNLKLESATTESKYKFKNLQLYPIRANDVFVTQHKHTGKFITLKEALAKKKVAITESSEEEVNNLFIENVSTDTVIVLSGEVVQGGKQDRMIAQEFVLYPKSGKKDVSVFCVEHGRWQPKSDGMAFNQYYDISSNEVRKAATVKKDQSEVWNKVAETTSKNNAQTSTGTLTALKNSGELKGELQKYTDFFNGVITNEASVIGVVAVSGDKVLGCDMFATHELLNKYYANLISSYATEAITNGKTVTVPRQKVDEYLQKIIDDESKQDKTINDNGTMLKDGKYKLHISTF